MDRLTDDERRLLELLAGSANGVSETLLVTRFNRRACAVFRKRVNRAPRLALGRLRVCCPSSSTTSLFVVCLVVRLHFLSINLPYHHRVCKGVEGPKTAQ
jgi:hypothetical protein